MYAMYAMCFKKTRYFSNHRALKGTSQFRGLAVLDIPPLERRLDPQRLDPLRLDPLRLDPRRLDFLPPLNWVACI
jgi:hypothetical protein